MMIRRFAIAIILGICSFVPNAQSQLALTASEETGAAGSTVDVDITVNNFEMITVMEFALNYDSLVMRFESLTFVTSDLEGFENESIAVPGDDPNVNIQEGRITCSFFNGNGGQDLPEGDRLFTARFSLVGAACDSTFMAFNSAAIYSDESFNTLTMTTNNGKVNIDGTDCNGNPGGGTDLTQTASHETVALNGSVCVPITVRNFNSVAPGTDGVGAGQGDIIWDTNIIEYTSIQNVGLPSTFSFNDDTAETGSVRFVWFSGNGEGRTLPDNTVLFELCYNAVGDVGDVSPINLVDWEWTDSPNDGVIPDVEVDGSVTIVGQPVEQFMISASNESADMGEEVCVDITVGNFNDIVGLEYRISWDASVLSFPGFMDGIQGINLPSLNASSFSYTSPNNFFTMSWNSSDLDLADGTVLYQVCFDVIGACGTSSDVSILPNGAVPSIIVSKVEGGTSLNLPASQISVTNGGVSVDCPPPCNVITVVGSCPGQSGGSVTVNVPTGNTYSWTNAAGGVVSTVANLLGVGAGTYNLAVTNGGASVCTLDNVVVPELAAPTITGNITNAGCSAGSINASVNNVVGSLTFGWMPDLGQTLNPMNLDAGTYMLTATDDGGCIASRTFEVTDVVVPLTANPTVTHVTCFGASDGVINLNVSGGCTPYTITWAPMGPTGANPSDLIAGTYFATIVDGQGTSITTSVVTISQPAEILLESQNIVNSNGNDGSISVVLSGGTMPYTYNWQPGPLPNSPMVTGLMPGNYTLAVTDDMGCTASFGPFPVEPIPTTGVTTLALTVPADFNGFDVACFGDQTATANVNVNGPAANFPGVLTFTGPETNEMANVTVSGTISFTGLGAGTYTASYTDQAGAATPRTITITEPLEIDFTFETGCQSEDEEDGFIDVTVVNGVGAFVYEWGDPAFSGDSADGLVAGIYTVMATDENGCQVMKMIEVELCDVTEDGCYMFPRIITPNGDQINDVFSAKCLRDFPAELTVWNRWGEEVFNMPSYDGTWRGTNQAGTDVVEGGYMWVLDINFGEGRRELMKGTVTVLRD